MEDFNKKNIYDSDYLAQILRDGCACAFPTDTIPAIATSPDNAFKIWEIKQRPLEKPLILMGSDIDQLFNYISSEASSDAIQVAAKYWPGALTIVIPSFGLPLATLNPKGKSLGMRIPNSELARELLFKSGPLATSSANLAGSPSPRGIEDVVKSFPELPLLGPIPWPSSSEMASTIIKWEEKGKWKLVREGSCIPSEVR
tara:strand:- start:42 stop:641 length:600 start_codon:yes stop_codon:yes gene_type:complete